MTTIKHVLKELAILLRCKDEAAYRASSGERQAAASLSRIRADHTARYEFAATYVQPHSRVIDMACGSGYGSHIIASQSECESVLSVDISRKAIDYATSHWSHLKVTYLCDDCLVTPLEPGGFDLAVSFETVEHIQEYPLLLERFRDALAPEGRLILSTPNQTHMPYSKERFPFHIRHFSPDELQDLLSRAGFRIIDVFSQPSRKKKSIIRGWDGKFSIVICEKCAHHSCTLADG